MNRPRYPELPRLIYSQKGVGVPSERVYDAINDNFAVKIVDAPIMLGEAHYRFQAIAQCRRCRKFPILQNWRMPKLDKDGNWLDKPSEEAIVNILGLLLERNHICPKAVANA